MRMGIVQHLYLLSLKTIKSFVMVSSVQYNVEDRICNFFIFVEVAINVLAVLSL